MKIIKLSLITFISSLAVLPYLAHADAKVYDAFTVHNNTEYDLYFYHTSQHCFASGKENGLPYTIKAHTSYSFTEKENNQGIPCSNMNKNMNFEATATMPDGMGQYKIDLHYERIPLDNYGKWSSNDAYYGLSKWEVGVSQTSVTDGQPGMSASSCQEQISGTKVTGDCDIQTLAVEGGTPGTGYYFTKDHHFKPMNVDITIGSPSGNKKALKFASLQLGDVSITDGFGTPVEPDQNGYVTLNTTQSYVYHFAKTQATCHSNHLSLTCPSSIEFVKEGSDEVVFTCAQTEKGNAACPWTLASNNPQPEAATDVYS
ncbi:hypothetical protein L3V82_05260 [Thiotrichales bacterium 19S3-7]|nr:hypothetical protein [Thiotrichales bacterium 19S3-7]MCF6801501.1 hypothetical protein [Thiotrichales bacterium 19S3-11]